MKNIWKKSAFEPGLLFLKRKRHFGWTRHFSFFAQPLYQNVCIDHRIIFTFFLTNKNPLLITSHILFWGVVYDFRVLCLFWLFIRETVSGPPPSPPGGKLANIPSAIQWQQAMDDRQSWFYQYDSKTDRNMQGPKKGSIARAT